MEQVYIAIVSGTIGGFIAGFFAAGMAEFELRRRLLNCEAFLRNLNAASARSTRKDREREALESLKANLEAPLTRPEDIMAEARRKGYVS